MELISIVVPCYNEQESLPLFYNEINKISQQMMKENDIKFEYMFVNDGSKDDTLKLLREMSIKDKQVRYVSFSRNFGKEAAMYAGLQHAKGDYVVVMDADLQHPPKFISEMYSYVKSGEYDCASTRRITRKGESKLLSFFARKFYKIINKISQTQIVDGAQDFRFMTRQMVDAILSMGEYSRFSKGIFSWVGFNTKYIPYENVQRVAGTSKWNFWKLFKYSFEGIVAFSTAPLAISFLLGIIACFASFVLLILLIINAFTVGNVVWQLGVMCVITLIGGAQFICTGIIGQYLSKTYMECKKRPVYVVGETEETHFKKVSH